eukprot:764264-Hanusia_phi.AAC.1
MPPAWTSLLMLTAMVVGVRAGEHVQSNKIMLAPATLHAPPRARDADNNTEIHTLGGVSHFPSKHLEKNEADHEIKQLIRELDAGMGRMSHRQIAKFREHLTSVKDVVMKPKAANKWELRQASVNNLCSAQNSQSKIFYDPGTQKTLPCFQGYTYSAIIYHDPPFVIIDDYFANGTAGNSDPGNVNQTRTPANGKLSGLSIDMMGALATNVSREGSCAVKDDPHGEDGDNDAWLLDQSRSLQTRKMLRHEVNLEAKILHSTQQYRLTQPFMESGFVMAVLESKKNSICISEANPSMRSWLDVKLPDLIGTGQSAFNNVTKASIEDCLFEVYTGKGGYCSDRTKIDQESCVCPTRNALKQCVNTNKNVWYSVSGSVVTTGNIFNPFGYGLVFPRNSTDYAGFSQAIEYIKQIGLLASIQDNNIPTLSTMSCSSVAGGSIQLSFSNIQGLFTLIIALLFVGLCVGLLEQIIAVVMYCMKPCLRKKDMSGLNPDSRRNSKISVSSDLMLGKIAQNGKLDTGAETNLDGKGIQLEMKADATGIGEENGEKVEEPSPQEIEMHQKITQLQVKFSKCLLSNPTDLLLSRQRGLAEIEDIIQKLEVKKSSQPSQEGNDAVNPLAATWQSFHANVRSFLGSKGNT